MVWWGRKGEQINRIFYIVLSRAIAACIICSSDDKGFCPQTKSLYSITACGRLIASKTMYLLFSVYSYATIRGTMKHVFVFSPHCLCASCSIFPPLSRHLSLCRLWQTWTMLSWTAVLWSPELQSPHFAVCSVKWVWQRYYRTCCF